MWHSVAEPPSLPASTPIGDSSSPTHRQPTRHRSEGVSVRFRPARVAAQMGPLSLLSEAGPNELARAGAIRTPVQIRDSTRSTTSSHGVILGRVSELSKHLSARRNRGAV
jgi:hypothetical protein